MPASGPFERALEPPDGAVDIVELVETEKPDSKLQVIFRLTTHERHAGCDMRVIRSIRSLGSEVAEVRSVRQPWTKHLYKSYLKRSNLWATSGMPCIRAGHLSRSSTPRILGMATR